MGKTIIVKKATQIQREQRYCKHCGGQILKAYKGDFCCKSCGEEWAYLNRNNKPKKHVSKPIHNELPYPTYSSQTEKFYEKYGKPQNQKK